MTMITNELRDAYCFHRQTRKTGKRQYAGLQALECLAAARADVAAGKRRYPSSVCAAVTWQSDRFGRLGSLNTCHFHKATYVAEGFEALCTALEYGLTLARTGAAFDADREAAAIAENGTAAERNARWEAYREGREA